jgi:hypothetical protein
VVVVALTAGRQIYYSTNVCDEQLTDAGTVVAVCRQLAATDPPMIAVGLIVLVALMTFFTEISGFGISLKREIRQAGATAKQADKKANKALSASSEAKVDAKDAQQTSVIAEGVSLAAGNRVAGAQAASLDYEIAALIAEYNDIRTTQLSGTERLSKMTALMTSLVAWLYGVSLSRFDVRAHLSDADGGRRLAGYAYPYANPTPTFTLELVEALLREETAFGQYWAIRALRRSLLDDPSTLTAHDRKRLEDFRQKVPDTDRARELDRVLAGSI